MSVIERVCAIINPAYRDCLTPLQCASTRCQMHELRLMVFLGSTIWHLKMNELKDVFNRAPHLRK